MSCNMRNWCRWTWMDAVATKISASAVKHRTRRVWISRFMEVPISLDTESHGLAPRQSDLLSYSRQYGKNPSTHGVAV